MQCQTESSHSLVQEQTLQVGGGVRVTSAADPGLGLFSQPAQLLAPQPSAVALPAPGSQLCRLPAPPNWLLDCLLLPSFAGSLPTLSDIPRHCGLAVTPEALPRSPSAVRKSGPPTAAIRIASSVLCHPLALLFSAHSLRISLLSGGTARCSGAIDGKLLFGCQLYPVVKLHSKYPRLLKCSQSHITRLFINNFIHHRHAIVCSQLTSTGVNSVHRGLGRCDICTQSLRLLCKVVLDML